MFALQNEGSHGNPAGVCDVRHTARKLITDQIIITDAETRSRTGCCNYDVICNRARYTKCATNSGGQRSFDWASILFQYPTTWFYSGARYTARHSCGMTERTRKTQFQCIFTNVMAC